MVFHKAFLISLGMHVLAIATVLYYGSFPQSTEIILDPSSIAVSFEPKVPRPPSPPPYIPPRITPLRNVEIAVEESPYTGALSGGEDNRHSLSETVESAPLEHADSMPFNDDRPVMSPADIRQSVHKFAQEYAAVIHEQQNAECFHERLVSARTECNDEDSAVLMPGWQQAKIVEQLFIDYLPDAYYSPLKRKLESEIQHLQPMIEAGGLVGELAKTRAKLNDENLKYLNREFSTSPQTGMTYTRICNPSPCVFRYNEFKLAPPQSPGTPKEETRNQEATE